MAIKIICLGKTREDWIRQGIEEYNKRLNPVWKIKWTELADISLTKAGSVESVKAGEALIIQKALSDNDYVIALDEHGERFDSVNFAHRFETILPEKNIVFVVGGVYGLDYTIINKSKLVLSFSSFTLPHQLIRLILIEQLYRAWTIISGKTYHY